MSDPFDLSDAPAYRSWREDKLGRSPTRIDALTVPLKTLGAPTKGELDAICEAVARGNLALIRCADPSGIEPGAMLGLGRHLGLTRLDANLCADEEAVSRIAVRPGGQTGEYIPYTDRPLSWHTDGYYNPQGSEVRAWMLFCVRDATSGGENALLDPELVYIRLRDQDPAMIAALMEPDAMTVPANVAEGRELRAASTGPVFSVIDGHLNMRYSARTRNIQWRERTDPGCRTRVPHRVAFPAGRLHLSAQAETWRGLCEQQRPAQPHWLHRRCGRRQAPAAAFAIWTGYGPGPARSRPGRATPIRGSTTQTQPYKTRNARRC